MVQTIRAAHKVTTESVLCFKAVCKSFGDLRANDNISFPVKSGVIHALVGENGAGKSTLTKILYGQYRADAGEITLDGRTLKFKNSTEARRQGIGMVFQQLALVPTLTVFENIVLGDPSLPFFFNKKEWQLRVEQTAQSYGFDFDLSAPVDNLNIAQRQKLEIFKLLWRDAKVLILDEPTSQLTPIEAEEILSLIGKLVQADRSRIVLLITHHIAEVLQFAGTVTVLRKGQCIKTMQTDAMTTADIAKLMVVSAPDDRAAEKVESVKGQTLLELHKVSTQKCAANRAINDVTISLQAGEIVGVAGISSSGQNELGLLVAGLLQPSKGSIKSAATAGRRRLTREKAAYIPSEQKIAFVPGLSVAANSFLKLIDDGKNSKFGFFSRSEPINQARRLIDDFSISPPTPHATAGSLSGGNLQRLIIGRELRSNARIIVADNPCAGLDASSSHRVAMELRAQAEQGRSVLFISPDLDQLIALCDRIIIMFNGRVSEIVHACDFDYQKIAMMMCGRDLKHLSTDERARSS